MTEGGDGIQAAGRSPEGGDPRASTVRLGEERVAKILERAAALDAKRNSEIEVSQLREAAAAAGISREAFDQALHEQSESADAETRVVPSRGHGPGTAQLARYTALLRDLLGDEAQVVVVEDRIEARDEGLTVSIDPASGDATAAIVAEGSLKRKLAALAGPAFFPGFLGFLVALEDEEVGVAWMIGVILTVVISSIGITISHRKELKELRKRAEQTRRQLQRMLPPPTEGRV